MTETIPCDLCHSEQHEVLFSNRDWQIPGLGEFAHVRCLNCGLVYLNPRPDKASITQFYPADYLPFRPAIEDEAFFLMRWMRRRKLVARRKLVQQYSGLRRGRLLDVGCATGLFLHEMELAGWQVKGVEISPHAVAYARDRFGLDVHQGMLEDAPFETGSFDAITFWDVLEHTFSPRRTLEQANCLLRQGGLVAINIPNWDSPDREWFGPHWIGYDPPRHLYVFPHPSLETLLDQTGFEILAWRCFMPAYFAMIESLYRALQVTRPRLARPVYRLLNVPGVRFLFEPYLAWLARQNRSTIISIFARKR
jgi:SAM-dependent methyltransferase